jgi:hypothetical protein
MDIVDRVDTPYTEKNYNKFTHYIGPFFGILERGVSTCLFIENNELQEEKQSKLLSIY